MQIPKIIHLIWLGTDPPHPLMMGWRRRWSSLNPDWQVSVWRELEVDGVLQLTSTLPALATVVPGSVQLDLLDRSCHLAQRANIWRYLVLRQHGGLYVDHDVEPLTPIGPLLESREALTARRQKTYPTMYENAFMAASPGHPWISDLVEGLTKRDPTITLSMGCDYLTEITTRHPEVAISPEYQIVFEPPDDWTAAKREAAMPSKKKTARLASSGALAVHHWASLWHKRGFVARPNPEIIQPPPPLAYLNELQMIIWESGTLGSLRVLEWGTGHSTKLLAYEASQREVGLVVTIDHHGAYQQQAVACCGRASSLLVHAVTADLEGSLTHDRHPDARRSNYATLPLEIAGPWDLIVIDGRRRLECALVASIVASEDTIIILHDYRRFRYQPVRYLLDVVREGPEYLVMKKPRP
jgi:hypothetical protein